MGRFICLGPKCPGCSTCDPLRSGSDGRFGKPMKNVTPITPRILNAPARSCQHVVAPLPGAKTCMRCGKDMPTKYNGGGAL